MRTGLQIVRVLNGFFVFGIGHAGVASRRVGSAGCRVDISVYDTFNLGVIPYLSVSFKEFFKYINIYTLFRFILVLVLSKEEKFIRLQTNRL